MSVALVTGAGQGIGRAIALGFSRRDTCVVVADVRGSNASRVQNQIRNTGKKALALEVDVSSEPSVTRMIECTLEEFGTIDVLVNDAGIIHPPRSKI
jgi:3-oxoacyl-[acyl-carrier protein] reductase